MAFLGEDGMLNDVTEDAVAAVGKGGGRPIPAGWYRAALVEDEVQVKHWGTGLSMQFQILGGDFENRRVFDYLCVRHSTSEQAEEIARAKLKAFGIAAGAKNPDDMRQTDPFYNRPVMIEVRRETPDDPKYGDEEDGRQARIADFMSVSEFKLKDDASAPQAAAPTNSPGAEPALKPLAEHAEDDIPW